MTIADTVEAPGGALVSGLPCPRAATGFRRTIRGFCVGVYEGV